MKDMHRARLRSPKAMLIALTTISVVFIAWWVYIAAFTGAAVVFPNPPALPMKFVKRVPAPPPPPPPPGGVFFGQGENVGVWGPPKTPPPPCEHVRRWQPPKTPPALVRLGDLLDHPDGERHQHNDDRGEGDSPVALPPCEGFFRGHDKTARYLYRLDPCNALLGRHVHPSPMRTRCNFSPPDTEIRRRTPILGRRLTSPVKVLTA